ncbi:MAG: hypothetical protein BGO06_20205, partial [Shinella sp. 65-6]
MGDMIDKISLIGGALIGGFVVFLGFGVVNDMWLLPRAEEQGRALERADTLKKAMELVQKRSRTNADVRNLD